MSEVAEEENVVIADTFHCNNCGSKLNYKPGTTSLKCSYCDTENAIPSMPSNIEELDFHEYVVKSADANDKIKVDTINCSNCGAHTTIDEKHETTHCPYCSQPVLTSDARSEDIIRPKSLLPFAFDKNEAIKKVRKWLHKSWFIPNDVKKATLNFKQFKALYLPYWTFDSQTHSYYVGQRGDAYYENKSVTRIVDGKSQVQNQQVRKIRWTNVSGQLDEFFDDILVPASNSVPKKYARSLTNWDLKNLTNFDSSYLSGFVTEVYQVGLEDGFAIGKKEMERRIRSSVKRQIGGDEQRILSVESEFNEIKFKHILLPLYISAYKYKGKVYQAIINGRTGDIKGERPISWIKVAIVIAIVVLAIAAFAYFA